MMIFKKKLKKAYLYTRNFLLKPILFLITSNRGDELPTKNVNKIIFLRIDRIGDMVLSTPALKAIKRKFPDSQLFVLSSSSNALIIENNPFVDHILIYNGKKRLFGNLNLLLKLRQMRFDLSIDPSFSHELKTALISLLIGAQSRIGYREFGKEIGYNCAVPLAKESIHFIDLSLGVLDPINATFMERRPEIFLTPDEERWAENQLRNVRNNGKMIIGIHPGAHYKTQRWPVEYFADIISLITRDKRGSVIIFGSEEDRELISGLAAITSVGVTIFIQKDVRKFISLLSKCNLLICNNSGPLHAAVAMNVPTISFMGPTIKERWQPLGRQHIVLRMDDLPCIGCNSGYCLIESHDCMNLITPDVVMQNIYQHFQQAGLPIR